MELESRILVVLGDFFFSSKSAPSERAYSRFSTKTPTTRMRPPIVLLTNADTATFIVARFSRWDGNLKMETVTKDTNKPPIHPAPEESFHAERQSKIWSRSRGMDVFENVCVVQSQRRGVFSEIHSFTSDG